MVAQENVRTVMDPRSSLNQLMHPYACFTSIREETHVQYNPRGKFWEVTDYEQVFRVVTEHEIFSSDETRVHPHAERRINPSILTTDPPRHRQLRALVTQAFTPRAIAQMAPRIEEITHELLDAVESMGEIDVIQDLSYPLPVIVIAEMLGIPIADRDRFKRWSDELVAGEYEDFANEDREIVIKRIRARVDATVEEMNDYFRHAIAQRRKQPTTDLISALLMARIEGVALSEPELLGFCSLLLIAGNITTTNLIGNAFLCFDENPQVMDRLRAQPELVGQAVEEVLRYRSPVKVIGRTVLEDCMLGGQQLKRGDFVLGWLSCANHDPAQFPHPERFDIERDPNRHVAFGHGIHFCLGAPLARLETKIALTIMLERLLDVKHDRAQKLEPVQSAFIYGAKHVPITFVAS
jgi:cytochrome P450